MGPNYACLFVGYVERKMLEDYQGNKPQLYKRYIDDVLGASSGTRQDLDNFIDFCSTYHPSLKYTFEISESSLSFLDLCLTISDARITFFFLFFIFYYFFLLDNNIYLHQHTIQYIIYKLLQTYLAYIGKKKTSLLRLLT